MKQILLVFIGGGFGSVLRFLVGKTFNNANNINSYGTFVVNILGSLFIGFILGLAAKNDTLNQNQTLFLATGFCGGFTTFSSFAYENFTFLKTGDFTNFAIYTITSFAIGILSVFGGIYLVKFF